MSSQYCEVFPSSLFLPPANEVSGKVMFLHLSVILFTGEGRVGLNPEGGFCIQGRLDRRPRACTRGGWQTPPGTRKAASTHPTRMLSCSFVWTIVWFPYFLTLDNACPDAKYSGFWTLLFANFLVLFIFLVFLLIDLVARWKETQFVGFIQTSTMEMQWSQWSHS